MPEKKHHRSWSYGHCIFNYLQHWQSRDRLRCSTNKGGGWNRLMISSNCSRIATCLSKNYGERYH
jgi:hypothetical protein